MNIGPYYRLGRKLLYTGGALTGLWLGGTDALSAQTPEPPRYVAPQQEAPVLRNFLNKNTIQLPIQIAEQSRAMIGEIQLFVKEHPGAPWTLKDKVGPAARAFTYQATRDGEYWFTMVTVDKQGRAYPADLRNEPPGLVVVIDTQAPHVELINLGQAPEGQLIQFGVRDANLDNARTRFHYQGGDRTFRALDPVPGRPGVYCIPSQAVSTGIIRVAAEDLAGNQTMREIHLNDVPTLKTAPTPTTGKDQRIDFVQQAVPGAPVGTPPNNLPSNLRESPIAAPPSSGATRPDGSDGPRTFQIEQITAKAPPQPQETHFPPTTPTPPPETLKRQFVNSARVFLDYQVENVGQSGVGKVEVWITRDRAKSWQKLSEDARRNNQVEVQFPGEGIFGITLVACNGRGASAAPPKAGDAPDWWVEVDTTRPTAQFTKVQAATQDGKAVVHIAWSVQDKNLSEAPVELSYGKTPQGPWLPITKGLPAEGQHHWMPPADIGAQAHLQLIVRDNAGNTTVVGSDAVQLDDPARPRAHIRGISTGAATAPTAPTPNPMANPMALPLPLQPASK
jgi:hypothetical protein